MNEINTLIASKMKIYAPFSQWIIILLKRKQNMGVLLLLCSRKETGELDLPPSIPSHPHFSFILYIAKTLTNFPKV